MGLDMYAYAVPKNLVGEEEYTDVKFPENSKKEDLFYWRKHYNLHTWMENVYRERGGNAESFNCANLRLEHDDLERLKEEITSRNSPSFPDYVEDKTDPLKNTNIDEDIANDLSFIVAAKHALDRGMVVFYDSWW